MADQITQGEDTTTTPKNEDKSGEKTFTQAEMNAILQNRLAEQKAKAELTIQESVNKALEEERRVASLSQKEREAELTRKSQETLSAKELELSLRQNKLDFVDKFNEAKIPTKLIDFVLDKDPKVMEANFIKLKETYSTSIADGIAEQLKGKTTIADPSVNNSGKTDGGLIRTF